MGPVGPKGVSYAGVKGNRGAKGPTGYTGPASDARAKTNVTLITDSLDKVFKLRGVEFLWDAGHKPSTLETPTDIGVIAQEVKEVLPNLVVEGPNGFLRVNYRQMTSLLVNAFNEQNSKLKQITKDIDSMS